MRLQFVIHLAIIIVAGSTTLFAQTQNARLGVALHGGIDLHMTAFSRIPEAENCCPEFTGGTGNVFGIGALYTKPLNSALSLDIRIGYYKADVDLTTTESIPFFNQGASETATIRHDLSVETSLLTGDILGKYVLSDNLYFVGGMTLGYALSGSYTQAEVFVTPGNATFVENGKRIRNQRGGDLNSLSSLYAGLTTGLSYDLPINGVRTSFISPEVLVTLSPTNLLTNTSWSFQRVRAGVAVSFMPPEIEEELSDIELFDIARTTPMRPIGESTNVPVPSVTVESLNESGATSPISTIRIEEFASNRVRPLLPYVFFDKGLHTLPTRYRQLTKDQTDGYSLSNFYNLDAMVTYYQLLNIVGKRLNERPDASIKLTACRDKSEEASSDDLSKRRALVIKSYLVDTWDINATRIEIEDRGMPSIASSSDDIDGAAENMRVEILSNDPTILSPVGSRDTLRVFSPDGLRFSPSVVNGVGLKTWTIFVSQNDQIIKAIHGQGAPPPYADWRIAETSRFIPKKTLNIEYMMVVQDSSGKVIPCESKSIPVSERSLSDKARTGGTDKSIDRYSLILFGFDRADLSPENLQLINEVKAQITPRSSVNVIGYTDRVGDATYNRTLSEKRAKAVASAIGGERVSILGLGETLPLYDNQTPEGRFYSRTVEINVETPR